MAKFAVGDDFAAGQELAAAWREFFAEILEILVGGLVDDRAGIDFAVGRVADGQFFGQFFELGDQFIVDWSSSM